MARIQEILQPQIPHLPPQFAGRPIDFIAQDRGRGYSIAHHLAKQIHRDGGLGLKAHPRRHACGLEPGSILEPAFR